MMSFEDKIVNLEFQEGRARDVLTVTGNGNKRVYFDFPNTLLSLNSLIDYKMESRKNRFSDSIREDMAKEYIVKFKQVIEKLIASRDLDEYVFFVDKNLQLVFDLE